MHHGMMSIFLDGFQLVGFSCTLYICPLFSFQAFKGMSSASSLTRSHYRSESRPGGGVVKKPPGQSGGYTVAPAPAPDGVPRCRNGARHAVIIAPLAICCSYTSHYHRSLLHMPPQVTSQVEIVDTLLSHSSASVPGS